MTGLGSWSRKIEQSPEPASSAPTFAVASCEEPVFGVTAAGIGSDRRKMASRLSVRFCEIESWSERANLGQIGYLLTST